MMRYLIFTTFLFIYACSQQAQEKQRSMENSENQFDKVEIDKVKDIPKGTNERSASFY
jgi:hypothetical protein